MEMIFALEENCVRHISNSGEYVGGKFDTVYVDSTFSVFL